MRLVETGAAGDGRSTDVMEIAEPDDLRDIANLGLSLSEAKQMLAAIQPELPTWNYFKGLKIRNFPGKEPENVAM